MNKEITFDARGAKFGNFVDCDLTSAAEDGPASAASAAAPRIDPVRARKCRRRCNCRVCSRCAAESGSDMMSSSESGSVHWGCCFMSSSQQTYLFKASSVFCSSLAMIVHAAWSTGSAAVSGLASPV